MDDILSTQELIKLCCMIIALLISIIGHEIMHGLVAYHYGDSSAKDAKRLSPNPLRHIDLFGSIILPGVLYLTQAPFLFGWAKPVPVDIEHIIRTRGFSAATGVALAGVAYNLALAFACSLVLTSGIIELDSNTGAIATLLLLYLVQYNILLFVFNLLPIPPLDGSRALLFVALKFGWLKLARFLESIAPFGIFIIFVLLFIPGLSRILFYPVTMLLQFLLG